MNEGLKVLAVGARGMAVAYEPSRQMVLTMFDLPSEQTHLVEDLRLAVQLSPSEARQLAGMLARKADEAGADSGLPSLEAKTYSPTSIRTAITEDGRKTILFDLLGVGAVAQKCADHGLRFLVAEVSKRLDSSH
jgi:hypothetical protein